MDSIGHRRLHPESAFTFPEQAARFRREGYEPVQNLLSRMKDVILKRFQLLKPRGSSTLGAERSLCAQATLSHGKLVISSTGSSTHLDCTHRVAW